MLKWVIETTELNSGVKYFLRGCLDAAMASDISTLGFGAIAPLLLLRTTGCVKCVQWAGMGCKNWKMFLRYLMDVL